MSRLTEILKVKRQEIAALESRRTELRKAALKRNDFRGFAAALDRQGDALELRLIAEVKQASPSVGLIAKEGFDPAEIARRYESAGANAISVLTDEQFFRGHLRDLEAVRAAVDLPILRKDFVLDEIQIYEAAASGADAVLLIVAALVDEDGDLELLQRLLDCAQTYQLDALVEIHSLEELDAAVDVNASIIGINNRNLKTFDVDLGVTEELVEQVPPGVIIVSESGIRTREDSERVRDAGVDAILVGQALVPLASKVQENGAALASAADLKAYVLQLKLM